MRLQSRFQISGSEPQEFSILPASSHLLQAAVLHDPTDASVSSLQERFVARQDGNIAERAGGCNLMIAAAAEVAGFLQKNHVTGCTVCGVQAGGGQEKNDCEPVEMPEEGMNMALQGSAP
jgi:hypothetical protein